MRSTLGRDGAAPVALAAMVVPEVMLAIQEIQVLKVTQEILVQMEMVALAEHEEMAVAVLVELMEELLHLDQQLMEMLEMLV